MDKNREKKEGKNQYPLSCFRKILVFIHLSSILSKKYLMSKINIAGTELDSSIEMISKNSHGFWTLQIPKWFNN